MYVEKILSCGTILCGDVVEYDASFDHALGRYRDSYLDVGNFRIIIFIEGMDYDVTNSFDSKHLAYFKDRLIEHSQAIFRKAK